MATKYPRARSWYLHWVEGGVQHRRSLGAVTEAEAEAQRLALERRLAGLTSAGGPTLAAWAEEYAAWHSEEYPDSYYRVEQILRSHLLPWFGSHALMAITRAEVERYKAKRRAAGAAPGTVAKELRTLQAMINRAVWLEIIPRNPAAGVSAPQNLAARPPRWYTREELQAIYQAEATPRRYTTGDDQGLAMEYRWTWQLLANTGMRRGEAQQLRWRDVGREEIRIVSEPEARTKSGRWRLIPVGPGASEALEALPRARARVLPQVAPTSLSRAFDKTLERASLNGSLHCLRHTYCSHLVMAGVPLRTVQVLAGHASMTTTERYAHLAPGHLREAVSGLTL